MAELSSDEMERLQREGNRGKLGQTLEDFFYSESLLKREKNPKLPEKSPAFTVQGSYDGVSVINLLQICCSS